MKRALAMALGAVMVAGSATQAEAASYVDFSGYYTAYFLNDVNLGRQASDESFTDSYFGHRFNLDVTFTPTDEIQVFWRLRGPNWQRWGNNGGMLDLSTEHIYGVIEQDFGTFTIGHFADTLDVYGLASLGYQPNANPMWTNVGPYDNAAHIDAIRYNNEWDNGFGLMGQYAKLEATYVNAGGAIGTSGWSSDADYDRIQLEATYKWDGGGAALGVQYDRNVVSGNAGILFPTSAGVTPAVLDTKWNNGLDKHQAWYINPAIMHSWGDFSVHFEAMLGWGDYDYQHIVPVGSRFASADHDANGYSFYLDADYNYGPGNVTLAGWWVSGSDLEDATMVLDDTGNYYHFKGDSNSLVNIDNGNFYPLLVAYNGNASGFGRVGTYGEISGANNGSAVNMANNAYENYIHQGWVGNFGHGQENVAYNNTDLMYSNVYLNTVDNSGAGFSNYLDRLNTAGVDAAGSVLPTWSNFQSAADATRRLSFNEDTGANHWAIALTGNHAFTDDITMHYGLAYLALNDPNYRVATGATYNINDTVGSFNNVTYAEQDTDLGFEIDLGFTFQLLDNLSFNTSFGYMFAGDAFKTLRGYNFDSGTTENADGAINTVNGVGNVSSTWQDADDTYVWYNTLTFSF